MGHVQKLRSSSSRSRLCTNNSIFAGAPLHTSLYYIFKGAYFSGVEGEEGRVGKRKKKRKGKRSASEGKGRRRQRGGEGRDLPDQCETGARFTKYLTTILRLSYDNAKVTIDLRRTSNLQNVLRRTLGFSEARFTRKVVRSSETVFANYLTIFIKEILALLKSLS